MPLHDWTILNGWDGVHQIWLVELLYALKADLPPAYRAYIGTTPTFAIGAPGGGGRPDVGVRDWPPAPGLQSEASAPTPCDFEPDEELAVATLAADTALLVERSGRLVAAIELVSPRNKDRASAQVAYADTYAGYLLRGINLVLVDLHRRPAGFAFPDAIAANLGLAQPPLPAPCAVGYRVGEVAPGGGRFLAVWRRPLAVGGELPAMRLPLASGDSVAVDLAGTYGRAAAAAYLG